VFCGIHVGGHIVGTSGVLCIGGDLSFFCFEWACHSSWAVLCMVLMCLRFSSIHECMFALGLSICSNMVASVS